MFGHHGASGLGQSGPEVGRVRPLTRPQQVGTQAGDGA